ncbi:MAG: MBL fold metallo-hydrolase [Prevotella sp.]|nr:MBL fold metallo-hydrolase [Prevotella sp.]
MLKFISFGSGSSGNCYLLATPTDALLIDIGVGLRTLKKSFRDYGCSFSQVHHVLITHDHADHIKSVGSFSHEYGVPVYATREVHEGINRNYCVVKKIAPGLTCLVEKGRQQQIGEFLVTPFEVPHDSTDNVGYLIEAAGVTFCIITDAGYVTDDMKPYIARAQYLVIEANHDVEMVQNGPYPQFLKERILSHRGHLNNRECGIALAENMSEHLRHVWLCHLSEENNHPELARKTVESVLRSYGIVVDADVQLEVLKRVTPMGPYELGVKSEE